MSRYAGGMDDPTRRPAEESPATNGRGTHAPATANGEVPLPPEDDTPLDIPVEVIREEVLDAQQHPESAEEAARPHAPYIVFDHVSKSFGDLTVLDDVSFQVLTGETLCILGRSGVGKSVSLQQIMGFLKPDKGRILVAGEDITHYTDAQMDEVRKKVTMVFQSGALFDSLSVGENVAFPLRERKELEEDQIQKIVNGLLDMVGVSGMADLLPSDLSTGMKRSVAIARAMASQPQAILYDEPTTMVDPLIGKLLGDLIQKLKTQLLLTSIVVTHDMRFAERLADHVVFLHQGKVRFFGTMEEMKQSDDAILRQFLDLDALVLPQV
jgi:ABC-type transporter Mla maintaining outer membrane lipid asymmetry ATPase subunit MlaF